MKETPFLTLGKMLTVTRAGVWSSCVCTPVLLEKKRHLHDVAKELDPRPNKVRKIAPLTTVGAIAGPHCPMDQEGQTHGCNSVTLKTKYYS